VRLLVRAARRGSRSARCSPISACRPRHWRSLARSRFRGLVAQQRQGRVIRCTPKYAALRETLAFVTEHCCAGRRRRADAVGVRGAVADMPSSDGRGVSFSFALISRYHRLYRIETRNPAGTASAGRRSQPDAVHVHWEPSHGARRHPGSPQVRRRLLRLRVLLRRERRHGDRQGGRRRLGLLPRIATGFGGGMAAPAAIAARSPARSWAVGLALGRSTTTESVEPTFAATQRLIADFEREFWRARLPGSAGRLRPGAPEVRRCSTSRAPSALSSLHRGAAEIAARVIAEARG